MALADGLLPRGLGLAVQSLAYPFAPQWRDGYCGTSQWLFLSTVVYALAACGLFVACTASIRLVVQRDAR